MSLTAQTLSNTTALTTPAQTGDLVFVERAGSAFQTTIGTLFANLPNLQPINSPAISGGTIDNAVIGGSTAAAGTFTTLTAASGSTTGNWTIGGDIAVTGAFDAKTLGGVARSGLLEVGDFGIGASSPEAVPNSDLDDIVNTGVYACDTGIANRPPRIDNGLILHMGRTSAIHAQLCLSRESDDIAWRYKSNVAGTWSAWSEVWHTNRMGGGTGLDADLLDGLHSSSFVRTDANTTVDALVRLDRSAADTQLEIGGTRSTPLIALLDSSGSRVGYIQVNNGVRIAAENGATDYILVLQNDGTLTWAGQQVFHQGNLQPNWEYTSAATTLTANTPVNFLHGLGAAPSEVEFDFVCTSANNGYVVGDTITGVKSHLTTGSNRGIHSYIPNGSTTTVTIVPLSGLRFASTSGVEAAMSFGDWDIIVKART